MLTVDDYGAIRRARRDGKSIRRIARELGLSRITVRKALKQPQPVAKLRDRPAPAGPAVTSLAESVRRTAASSHPAGRLNARGRPR